MSSLRLILVPTALAAALSAAVDSTASAQDTGAVIAEVQSKIVKLYGAGGFRGLEGYGTGFLASAEGHVVTSWGPLLDAELPVVVLNDGRRFEAKLVGADPASGIAVLKIDNPGGATFPHFDLANFVELAPGDRILALSNMFKVAAGDEPVSVMHGMILAKAPLSARRGRFETNLETPVYFLDAVTNNPGAAGGVIVSLDGRLAGMIGRELRGEATETWINYALPAAFVAARVGPVVAGGEIARSDENDEQPAIERRAIELGLVLVPDVTARTPAFVSDVLDDSIAREAGFQRDDLILFANGTPVRSIRELTTLLSRAERGDEMTFVVRRAGRLVTLTFLLP